MYSYKRDPLPDRQRLYLTLRPLPIIAEALLQARQRFILVGQKRGAFRPPGGKWLKNYQQESVLICFLEADRVLSASFTAAHYIPSSVKLSFY